MERLKILETRRDDPGTARRARLCLRCSHPVPDRPRGCKGCRCQNCGHPYPLGDCSD